MIMLFELLFHNVLDNGGDLLVQAHVYVVLDLEQTLKIVLGIVQR